MYKVYIRPLKVEDAKISYQWRNDPEIWKFTGSKPDREITYEIEKEWIKKMISDESCRRFAIIADGNYIGNIQLTNIKDKKAEYHIFIGDKLWWGKGIAHLATYQILHYAKEELQLEEVFLSVREENIAAIKSYIKSSFVERESADGWIKMVCALEQLPEPMVSVFVMVYNHEKYLHECLEGILMQQCNFPFNIVVGEDCSPDRSREILLEYNQKYPGKFKLLLHDKNIGAVANQNAVLSACTGKYIAMCEGDDYWTDPLKMQKQVDFLEGNEEYVLTFHPVKIKNPDGSLVDDFITEVPTNYELQETLALKGNYIHTPSVVFRNVIKDFPPEFSLSPIGDYFLYMILTKNGKMKMLNDNMAVYRQGVGVWSNEGVVERQATTVFCLELLGIYFKADKTIYSLLRAQRKNLLEKMLNFSVKKEDILADFVSNLDEVEIRLTPKSLMSIILLKLRRKLMNN